MGRVVLIVIGYIVFCPATAQTLIQENMKDYLSKYGYPVQHNQTLALRMFQQMSGLSVSGLVNDETLQQTDILRCGADDIVHHHDHLHKTVHHYHIQTYPHPDTSLSMLDPQEIDNVVFTASQLWNTDDQRLVKGDADTADVMIIFCDLSQCLDDHGAEEMARPVYNSNTGVMTIYLDSLQSWADSDTLSSLTYGANFNVHVQLLQVMLHQFGHVLGLTHTNRVTSAMQPFYYDWISESELRPDNIDTDMTTSSQSTEQYSDTIVVLSAIIITSLL